MVLNNHDSTYLARNTLSRIEVLRMPFDLQDLLHFLDAAGSEWPANGDGFIVLSY